MRRVAALASAAAVVLLAPASFISVAAATLPGPDGKIVYDEQGNLYSTDPGGRVTSRLTSNGSHSASDREPDFAPDGERIAFERVGSDSGTSWIYTMDADGTNLTKLRPGRAPTFGPGGRVIAFVSGGRVFLMRSDGSGARAITEPSDGIATSVSFAPGGREIAFAAEHFDPQTFDFQGSIFSLKLDGSSPTRLTSPDDDFSDSEPDFSPDGERIAFVRESRGPDCFFGPCPDVYVMGADGSNEARLSGGTSSPSFSPGGSRLAVESGFGFKPQRRIAVIDADGTNYGSVPETNGGISPDWGPRTSPPEGSCHGRAATIVGTRNLDVIHGTPTRDVIVSLGHHDRILAGGGNDLVCAGDGPDRVDGEAGDDRIYGGPRPDRLFGGPGDDELHGGRGRDECSGGTGSDTLGSCEAKP